MESNALALEKLKLGMVMRELDGKILQEWLHNFSSDGIVFPYVPKEIVPWLEKGRLNEIGQLSEKLWAKN